MAGNGVTRIRELFRPEEVVGRHRHLSAAGGPPTNLSLKAVFWCAMGVAISLVIGTLL